MNYQRLTTFVATALTWAIGAAIVFQSLPTHAQDSNNVTFRSRAELLANRRKVDEAFPEVIRALRTLHLPPHKIAEAETKLRLSESATRAARQELQALEVENERQSYNRQSTKTERAEELRSSLQQSKDQLHADIKTLLDQNQREQFDRHLQKRGRHKASIAQRGPR